MAHSQSFVEQAETARALAGGGRVYEARLADGRWLQINERRTKDGGYVSVGTDISASSGTRGNCSTAKGG